MTLEERDAYTRTHRGNIDNIPHYAALTPSDSRYAALAYNALLFSKGLLLNSTIELSRLLQEAGDKETLSMLDRWRSANQKYRRAQDEEHPDAEKFKAQCEQLERRLMERSTVYGDYTAGLTGGIPAGAAGSGPERCGRGILFRIGSMRVRLCTERCC